MNKLLSIIIPVYNAEKYIEKCIFSIVSQDISKDIVEIVIVDDGSSDSSCSIIKNIQSQYDNIYLFSQPNGGVSSARNLGISKAKGKYIQFIDIDDYLEKDSLGSLSKYMNDDIELIFFKYRQCYDGFNKEGCYNHRFTQYNTVLSGNEFISQFRFYYSVWTCLFNRDFLIRMNTTFSPEIWGEDILFLTELLLSCKKAVIVDKIIYNYVLYNADSTTHCIDKTHQLKLAQSYQRISFKLRGFISIPDLNISEAASKLIIKDSNLYNILAIIKMLKYGASFKAISEFYALLDKQKALPIKSVSVYATPLIKILFPLFNCKYFIYIIHCIKSLFNVQK